MGNPQPQAKYGTRAPAVSEHNADATNVATELAASVKLYHDIGLDTHGRSHHYSPKDHEIVVCNSDQRGVGITDDDIEQRITPGDDTTGVWDYIQFVRDEVDDVEWTEVDAPEQPPEEKR